MNRALRDYLSHVSREAASDPTSAVSGLSRRGFLKGASAGAATIAFTALSQNAMARGWRHRPGADYGPLLPTRDEVTGLPLINLPRGFRYQTYGWTGQALIDGQPTPEDHDGMAVVARKGRRIALVRNHELSPNESPAALCDGADYDPAERGGTTNLVFDLRRERFEASWCSLSGTNRNCAGGATPWGSWITCEETFPTFVPGALNHGYVFEVPGFGIGNPTPIRAAGRFAHEAVAIDPRSGVMYETEDATPSALYRFEPTTWGNLHAGGTLTALAIVGEPDKDMTGGLAAGAHWQVEWVPVGDPEGTVGRPFDSAPGAAGFARLEGCWYDSGLVYFVSTSGGAAGLGQVYAYDPRHERLTLLFESPSSEVVDGPDNIAVSPRGGILLCEDGDNDPQRLVGLSVRGEAFPFAENAIALTATDLATVDRAFPGAASAIAPGVYTGSEWAGATFYEEWLFVNIQTPGVTFAITGPWKRGAL
ncbi:MAG: DUF839 domain-containing protein [Chromatiales bacterium]|nr:DUF839 domain-containing protein [Chromatiales bacterium]